MGRGCGYALTDYGAQGETFPTVHADPAGASRNAAYVQSTRNTDTVHIYTGVHTLEPDPAQRGPLYGLDEPQRADYAAKVLGDLITDQGWRISETAHAATGTPIPQPEPPAATEVSGRSLRATRPQVAGT